MPATPPHSPRLIVNQQYLRTKWSGGAGTYAEELVARLERDHADATSRDQRDLLVLNRPEEWDTPAATTPLSAPKRGGGGIRHLAARWVLPPGFHEAARGVYRRLRPARRGGAAGEGITAPSPAAVTLPWGDGRPVVFHELTNYDAHPLIGHACADPNVKLCVTFLDLQDFYHPEFFPPEVISQRRRNYAFYRQHASLFFAISEFTKRTMVELLGIDPERVLVTPLAGDEAPVNGTDTPEVEAEADAAARAHGRYLIYPAKPWRHKNHATLLAAMGEVAAVAREAGLSLLLTGGMSEAETAALAAQAAAAGAGDRVVNLGFRSRAALRGLLRNAEMMIFPSLFEGFGMPVLEAQSLGCPVACSNAASLPEVAGDAALLFDPLDKMAIAQVIADVAARRFDRLASREAGYRNIRRFTWDATHQATLEGYARLSARPGF